jgi:glycosyltransferase involved in cell wall biosynthesis
MQEWGRHAQRDPLFASRLFLHPVVDEKAGETIDARPQVTVITPSLNHGSYLAQNLASVALQGSYRVEQLILDGGSTDSTQDVVAAFDHAQYVHLPKSNQSEALNEGFRRAKGEVICWLNTDDIVLPGAFETALSSLERSGPRTYFTSHYLMVDEALRLLRRHRVPLFSSFLYRNYAVYLPTSGSFISNTVAADGISLDPSLEILMDRDYALKLFEGGYQFVHHDGYLSAFRLHQDNKSGVGRLFKGQTDPRAERRLSERQRLSENYGGIFLGARRLVGPSPLLSKVAWAALVANLRARRLRVRAEDAVGLGDMAPTLARWTHKIARDNRERGL